MKSDAPKPIYLADYRPPDYLIETVDLHFELEDEKTTVASKLFIKQSEIGKGAPLVLNGESMQLLSIKVDGKPLAESQYQLDEKRLTIPFLPASCILEIVTQINPQANTALDGLYKSGGIFCTQNEPEGFRRITYFLDRPDVMSKYTTTIVANKERFPLLLSNGNLIGKGDLVGGKHWAQWEDPFAKPCYLFALVAGDLGCVEDVYTTRSGRKVDLKIYCDKGNESKCQHAMQSLIYSMKWDEDVFGLEYDLDIYMIVAVDSFNMGAMENKGLNIFNTNCVMADAASATDDNFTRVEKVIAHEYFHNWTGNRITCRDWFQLTLKEGLTVFRDQEFSADRGSVHRIEDVQALRELQFAEDAGPMAHPIKPSSYIQINNFYTTTVYKKGAEVIRMIRTLIGKENFRRGIDRYFELYDGQAVTTDDFVHAMEWASGKDLTTQFKRWYTQSGTPHLDLSFKYDAANKRFEMTVEQSCAPTPDGSEKLPFYFPFKVGLLNDKGESLSFIPPNSSEKMTEAVLCISQAKETFIFEDVFSKPIPSVNRDFTAPITLAAPYSRRDYALLMAYDPNQFNRWDASQTLATQVLLEMVEDLHEGLDPMMDEDFMGAFGKTLADPSLDKALKARLLSLPSEEMLHQKQKEIDFDAVHLMREFAILELATRYEEELLNTYKECHSDVEYTFDAVSVGNRALKNLCLFYLSATYKPEFTQLCEQQFLKAKNMTDHFSALALLNQIDSPVRQKALDQFYERWKHDPLVMCKWLSVQAFCKLDGALERVKALTKAPPFDFKVPNLVRALFVSFMDNHVHFNANNGEGYAFLADTILYLDPINSQMAAKLAGGFKKYAKLDFLRKKAMKEQLERILAHKNISNNVYEIVYKTLKSDQNG
ncbi:aminopeptidase N [Parachlamydia sp. AcF125]|uniref:aminopeptidase N n=1 Tax=Parachlamydia sp. AcF125 TaxID=2795736 RepID=UPI001BCA50B8|nr:aminopeptidase N [Parachlamydia sp. AcF125]MBS4167945.1 Aminopeptidase N [Parachlamydia sp. AcF125]